MQYHNDFIKLSLYSFLLKVVLHTQETVSSNSSPLTQVPMHMYSIQLLTGSKAGPWDSIWPGMHQCHHNHIAFCHWASPLLWMLLRHCFSEISSQQMGHKCSAWDTFEWPTRVKKYFVWLHPIIYPYQYISVWQHVDFIKPILTEQHWNLLLQLHKRWHTL
jgi:hypothetical protein